MKNILSPLFLLVSFSLFSSAEARDTIKIVGSSTVYPFATVVAEEFGRADNGFKAPIIESTGSGGGLKPVSYTHLRAHET